MKKIYFLICFLSFNFCFSQGFQAPEYLCTAESNINFYILETYKDSKSNEYIIFGKINSEDSLDIYIQKYNVQEKPVFEGCGKYITSTTLDIANISIGVLTVVRCITDVNDNIFVFISVPKGVEGPYTTFNLHCYKIDSNGNSLWAKIGNDLTATSIYIFIHDIEATADGDIHLIYQFSEYNKLGYIRVTNNGNLRFQPKDLGAVKYDDLINPEINDHKKHSFIFKNSLGEVVIAKANYEYSEEESRLIFEVSTYKVDILGNVTKHIIDNDSRFIQFNKIENELYLIENIGDKFYMYKFNSESFVSTVPTLVFDEKPFQQLKKKGTNYFYFYRKAGKIYIQKLNENSEKQFPNSGVEIPNISFSISPLQAFDNFPDEKGGVHVVFVDEKYKIIDGGYNILGRYVSYQYINAFGILQIPSELHIYYPCEYTSIDIGMGFYDEKDGSLNAYITSSSDVNAITRHNVLYAYNPICPKYQITKKK
ncbi:hypothetical protein GCM10011514_43690 [Emticicia aquatilis]|uniref:Uncharacterized protein n=1 Tax=Emticicia aquatilis TaxID=1537369 RepID=A0A916Z3C6_9BACT|nr:hypothetical protein [Emticicia aquatilis]GGD74934.1 hypothetical protein GCM10011514_43690 [Emticicia aquatilis]